MGIAKVIACIKAKNNFLITTHTNMEGDALGAELAFYRLLRQLSKRAMIVNDDIIPSSYDFLPDKDKIQRFKEGLRIKFDCFVTLDCSDLNRSGGVYRLNSDKKTILNIDHHISNLNFGDINWVEPYSSSCSEMIYKLYKKLRLPIDSDTAVLLYTGILTDTGSFRYANTTYLTHRVASDLIRRGVKLRQIYKNIYENMPLKDIRLLTKILPRLRTASGGRIAWFQLRRNLLKNREPSFDLGEYILSFARSIKNVEVAVLFKENLGTENEIRVNFRSQGAVDVNKIASFFGGGGHQTASGATVHGKIEQVRIMVLAKIKKSLR